MTDMYVCSHCGCRLSYEQMMKLIGRNDSCRKNKRHRKHVFRRGGITLVP